MCLLSFFNHLGSLAEKANLSLRSLEKKRNKEVVRRLQIYATIGLPGHILFFIRTLFLSVPDWRDRRAGPEVILKALPDQNFLATQKLVGLALPFATIHPIDNQRDAGAREAYSMFAELFVSPTFVEALFTLIPWNDYFTSSDLPFHLFVAFFRVFSLTGLRGAYCVRLLSLRDLPRDSPRWSDESKVMLNNVLDLLLRVYQGGSLQSLVPFL